MSSNRVAIALAMGSTNIADRGPPFHDSLDDGLRQMFQNGVMGDKRLDRGSAFDRGKQTGPEMNVSSFQRPAWVNFADATFRQKQDATFGDMIDQRWAIRFKRHVGTAATKKDHEAVADRCKFALGRHLMSERYVKNRPVQPLA
jgi:hypothetical protein